MVPVFIFLEFSNLSLKIWHHIQYRLTMSSPRHQTGAEPSQATLQIWSRSATTVWSRSEAPEIRDVVTDFAKTLWKFIIK
jgi:hypothetical protein